MVRVVVALKLNYTGAIPPADSFSVTVSQAKPIEPRKISSTVTCDPLSLLAATANVDCSVYTREILLSFDAEQFAPGKATVKVSLPDDQALETKYNLDTLK